MMVVDASAILAVILEEEDAERFEAALLAEPESVITAVNYWEVLARAEGARGSIGLASAEALIGGGRIGVVAADAALAREAVLAFSRFGRRSPAGLNLKECFAYALAARQGDGLLYKGNDFAKTDVKSAVDP